SETTLPYGRGAGGQRDRAPCEAAARTRPSRHYRPRSDRRSNSWRTADVLLQRTLRQLVLPAGDGFRQLQRRSRTVSVCGCAAPRQRDRTGRRGGILCRLLMMVRHFFSGVRIRIRLDGGFAHPALLDFLDAEPNLEYVVAMASNAVLQRKAEEAMQVARVLCGVAGQTEHIYSEASYAAGSWEWERRILIKAEVV